MDQQCHFKSLFHMPANENVYSKFVGVEIGLQNTVPSAKTQRLLISPSGNSP